MRKCVFTTLLAIFAFGTFAQKAEVINQNHKNDGLARWSLGIKGGADYYRVTPYTDINLEKDETRLDQRLNSISWNGNFFVEYNPNPIFGIGLNFGFSNYDRNGQNGEENKYYGQTMDGILYNSINISNLVSPQRTGGWKKVSFYVGTGIGGGAYSYKQTASLGFTEKDEWGGENKNFDKYSDKKFSLILMANAGLDFSLAPWVSFMLESEYRYYNMNDLGGRGDYSSSGNDAFFANAGFRFKIGKNHVRNMTYDDYYKPTIMFTPERDQEVYDRLAALESDNAAIKKDLNDVKSDITGIKNDVKDIKDALAKMEQKEVVQKVTATAENIEFKTGSAVLTEESKVLLDEVANLLNSIAWIKLDIAGHTDNVGNADKNKKLSQDRANAVKDYLVGKGLDENKMSSVGYGPEKPIASNNTEAGRQRNRRVEFAIK
ncbi:MAG: OmpA family protein [Bacteroidales bacterium]|nr:OmpA family protein [Bacteroidales bacterium]